MEEIEQAWLENSASALASDQQIALAVVSAATMGEEEAASRVLRDLNQEQLDRFAQLGDESRRREWLAARWAELKVRAALQEQRIGLESIHTSVTHSHGLALALGWGGGGPRWGIDLEPESRVMSPAAAGRIRGPEEEALGLSPLETWVIKEACFKAQAGSQGAISQFRLVSFSPENHTGIARSINARGSEIRFLVRKRGGWIVAFAQSR